MPADESTSSYMNRRLVSTAQILSNVGAMKSNPVLANRGDNNKMSLWGSCSMSLIVARMREFITTTAERGSCKIWIS